MAEHGARKYIITATVITASLLELIDTTIVNVSLPQIMGNLGATFEDIGWVVTGYAVANVIVLPMSGWLGRRFGRKNYFLASIIIFTLASFMCGNAHSLSELVVFRIIQGLAGGGLLSTSQAILLETWPREQMGMAQALFGIGAVVGPTLGPTVGGYITDHFNWPWIFYVNIPVGMVAAMSTLTFIRKDDVAREETPVDWAGIGLLAASIGCLQFVLEKGQSESWFETPYIAVLTFLCLIFGVLFIWRELSTDHPVVNFSILKYRSFRLGMLTTLVLGFALYSSAFVQPVFCQNLLGFTAQQTGMMLIPGGLATILMMPVTGTLLRKRFPAQVLSSLGMIMFFIFTQMLSHLTLAAGMGDFFWPLVIRGIGMSILFVPITTLALQDVPKPMLGQATGLNNMMRQLGGSFGIAVMTTLVASRYAFHRSNLLDHISMSSPQTTDRLNMITHGLMSKGYTLSAAKQIALQSINGSVIKQTYLLTYSDAFWIAGVFCLVALPLLLLQRFKRGDVVLADAH